MSRHEAKFIKGIIKDVLNKLSRKYLYVPEHLIGMDQLARNIFDFLSTATDDWDARNRKDDYSKSCI